jgi:hypothetical protein
MCFSAEASFTLGVVLTGVGVLSLRKVKDTGQIPFAIIPIFFGLQQLTEGVLWVALKNPQALEVQNISTLIFLFFAQGIWPFWVPYSIFKMQKELGLNLIQKLLLWTGGILSLILIYCLFNYPVEATIEDHHIAYYQYYPDGYRLIVGFLYLSSVIVPPFLSKVKYIRFLGPGVLVSYLLSSLFYERFVVSVWCFFAAGISLFVLFLINTQNKLHFPKTKNVVTTN